MVNYESGDLAESSRLWESVLSVEPNYPPALFYQGLLLAEAGLKAEATRHLQMAVGRIQLENLYHEKAQSLLKDLASAPARQPDSIQ